MRTAMKEARGFSLIELAIVLFIISLLLGGLLVPLATQLDARKRNDAQEQLERIKEALIGYAIINGYLPCYTTETDPTNSGYGEAIASASCNPGGLTVDGILPWKTLGLASGLDPWGVQRSTASDPWTGYWRYRVHNSFANPFVLTTSPSTNLLCVVDSAGSPLVSTSETPVAIVYSTGADLTADGQNASYEATSTSSDCKTNSPILYQGGEATSTFDDVTIWITRPLLFNRMVSAGTLP